MTGGNMTGLGLGPADHGLSAWRQIYDALEQQLRRGEIKSNERLPSETQLADRYGVHRLTVRRAVARLQQVGLVRIERGRGTFADSSLLTYRVHAGLRFDDGIAADRRGSEKTLALARIAASAAETALWPELDIGEPLISLRRLRLIDEVPVVVNSKLFPAGLLPEFETVYALTKSVAAVFRHHGRSYRRAWTSASVGFADQATADHLRQSTTTPVLLTRSVNQIDEGAPCEFSTGIWAAGRVELVFDE